MPRSKQKGFIKEKAKKYERLQNEIFAYCLKYNLHTVVTEMISHAFLSKAANPTMDMANYLVDLNSNNMKDQQQTMGGNLPSEYKAKYLTEVNQDDMLKRRNEALSRQCGGISSTSSPAQQESKVEIKDIQLSDDDSSDSSEQMQIDLDNKSERTNGSLDLSEPEEPEVAQHLEPVKSIQESGDLKPEVSPNNKSEGTRVKLSEPCQVPEVPIDSKPESESLPLLELGEREEPQLREERQEPEDMKPEVPRDSKSEIMIESLILPALEKRGGSQVPENGQDSKLEEPQSKGLEPEVPVNITSEIPTELLFNSEPETPEMPENSQTPEVPQTPKVSSEESEDFVPNYEADEDY